LPLFNAIWSHWLLMRRERLHLTYRRSRAILYVDPD
jgi:hypothetical protein